MFQQRVLWFLLFLLLSFSAEARLKKPSPPPFDILHYKIDITLNEKELTYQAKTSIQLRSLVENLKEVTLHFREGTKKFSLPIPLRKGEEVMITAPAEGKADERVQNGLFAVRPDPKGLPQFFTQFETTGARNVFPCFDEPFDKATTEVVLTANARYTLLSNGKKVSEKILTDGRKQVHFVNDDPISTYHITLVAAQLTPLRDSYASISGKRIPLSIYVRPGHVEDVTYAMQVLKRSLKFYENYFGLAYPWDSYGIVALPGFQWGGMENKGLANLNEARLLWNPTHPVVKKEWIAGLVAHELAHEWFGNKVTMTWWDDLWLNEAFATFATLKFEETVFGKDYVAFDNFRWLAEAYFPQDRGAFSHPIVPDKVDTLEELFDSVTYAKGVQVVRMLEDFVGPENFRKGLQNYFAKHHLGNATTQEFLSAMEEASGIDLKPFAQSWLHQKGYPELVLALDENRLTVEQKTGPFVFKLNVGDQTLTVTKKKEAFPWEGEGVAPINRGGRTLVRYEWKEKEPIALNDSDPFVRFETTYAVIARNEVTKQSSEIIAQRLRDKSLPVVSGVVWTLTSNRLDSAFAKEMAQGVWKEAYALYPKLSKTDPVQAELRSGLLTLLGQADRPGLFSFLRNQVSSDLVDDQLGALAGLLRSSDDQRYAIFERVLAKNKNRGHLKLELLRTLAMTPKKEVLVKINQYLADASLVAKDDSSIPIRVWREIHRSNKDIVYSSEGVKEVTAFVKQNIDRPSVAGVALSTLEEAASAPKEIRKEIQTAMRALLKNSPPDYLKSLGEKILTAARK